MTIHWAEIRQLPVLAVDLAVGTQVSFFDLKFLKKKIIFPTIVYPKIIIYVVLLPDGQKIVAHIYYFF